jgi:hypothetical protein
MLITKIDFQSEVISGLLPRLGKTLQRFYCRPEFLVFLASIREPLRVTVPANGWRVPILNRFSHSELTLVAAKFQSLHVTEIQQCSSFNCHHFAFLSRLAFALALRAFAAACDAFIAISFRFFALSFFALARPPLRPISESS